MSIVLCLRVKCCVNSCLPVVLKVKKVKPFVYLADMKARPSIRPAYSAPLVLNLQHYHWYAATHSPSP